MKKSAAGAVLFLSILASLLAENPPPSGKSISFEFDIDGQPVKCKTLTVNLSMGGKQFAPTLIPGGFIVPPDFIHAYFSKRLRTRNNVDATVKCDEFRVSFMDLYPVDVLPGSWEAGISYPISWFSNLSHLRAPEQGTWVSYLVTNCSGCDPGIVHFQSHSEPPQSLVTQLKEEQPNDTGERARDVAYTLAVFNVDYMANRDVLVKKIHDCLSRPPNWPEDDGCDTTLVGYLSNLYWRGDDGLLTVLFGIAERRADVLGEVGWFYADMLTRRTAAALDAMRALPAEKQRDVCDIVTRDDLGMNSPRLKSIVLRLQQSEDDVSQRCLEELKKSGPAN